MCLGAFLALVLTACAGSTASHASDPCVGNEPARVVCGFYRAYLEVQPIGLPNHEQEKALAPYLSPALVARMDGARRYQEAFETEHPNEKPPFVDGSLFTSMYEGFDRFEIVQVEEMHEDGARVTVRFGYEDAPPWEDIVILTRGERYAIDDIVFLGAGQFNPAHRLTEALSWRE